MWVGFVDDDDTVGPDYVSLVAADAEDYDCISFRMRWVPWAPGQRPFCYGYGCSTRKNRSNSEVLPEWNATSSQFGHVGISFALRTSVTRYINFTSGAAEDYYMRLALFKKHLRVMQSPHVTYYVKGEPRAELPNLGLTIANLKVSQLNKYPGLKAVLSYEYQLARELAANGSHDYEHYRRSLLRTVCHGHEKHSQECKVCAAYSEKMS